VKRATRKLDDAPLLQALTSGFRNSSTKDLSNMFAKLKCTIKTHKDPGAVVPRPIHSCVATPLAPAMRWISWALRPYLQSRRHLLRDSFEAVRRIGATKRPPNVRFYRFDLKDFFLSGEHKEIVRLCTQVVADEYKDTFAKLCSFILSSQYVRMSGVTDVIWRVKVGAGMGLSCAGDLANVTFDRAVEVPTLNETNFARYQVLAYWRYMDDGLILGHGARGTQVAFIHGIRDKAQATGFIFKIESASATSCVFLDLDISKTGNFEKTGILDVCVHRKPTSLAQPSRPTSFHPPGVHGSWPLSMVNRSMRLCTRELAAEEDISMMRRLWQQYGIYVVDNNLADTAAGSIPIKASSCRLIVPYHWCWAKAKLKRVLDEHTERVKRTLRLNKTLDISWKLGYQHLASRVASGSGFYDEAVKYKMFLEE
jgi:hypothetical protein